MQRGADSVVLVPVARVLDLAFWETAGNPYVARVQGDDREDFDIARWPRGE